MEYAVGVSLQLFAVIGVRYRDQGRGTLPQVLTVQVGDPVFGDNIMHMRAAGGDTGTRL
jgi:hypothetical protein